MAVATLKYITEAEYLALEEKSEVKHEYYAGQIYAMAGGSFEHGVIAANVITLLNRELRSRGCVAGTSDVRVRVAETGLNTYPDVTVVCGKPRLSEQKPQAVTNPTLLVEVLSASTEGWDRGGKWHHYQTIDSLTDYLLVSADSPCVEHYTRAENGGWIYNKAEGLATVLRLESLGADLPLTELYLGIAFSERPILATGNGSACEPEEGSPPELPVEPETSVSEVDRIVERCRAVLPLDNVQPESIYGHASLPLCVIDAVWSMGVRYTGVQNVLSRYCARVGLPDPWSPGDRTPSSTEHRVSDLIREIESRGTDRAADELFCNHQRTSTRNGILKSEAVLRFARALAARGIESLEDISRWEEHAGIEDEIRAIPGQASGRSLAYFRMLTGEENRIKPDRMIHRFVSGTIGRNTTDEETLNLIRSAAEQLRETYPAISARWLDNLIWSYQREQLGSAREE